MNILIICTVDGLIGEILRKCFVHLSFMHCFFFVIIIIHEVHNLALCVNSLKNNNLLWPGWCKLMMQSKPLNVLRASRSPYTYVLYYFYFHNWLTLTNSSYSCKWTVSSVRKSTLPYFQDLLWKSFTLKKNFKVKHCGYTNNMQVECTYVQVIKLFSSSLYVTRICKNN